MVIEEVEMLRVIKERESKCSGILDKRKCVFSCGNQKVFMKRLLDEVSEFSASSTKIKSMSKISVIKVNDISMQYFEKININT